MIILKERRTTTMPNWCFTEYVIEGDPKEVANLHQKLSGLLERKESLVENGFGKNWLGNVAELFGKSWEDIKCKGTFLIHDVSDDRIGFSTESAWVDCYDLWVLVCSHYKTLRFYYQAEECGCCYWDTNDFEGKYFPERYMLNIWDEDIQYFDTDEEVLKYVSEKLEFEYRNILEFKIWIEKHNEIFPDRWVYLNEFHVTDRSLTISADESADETSEP